MYFTDNKEGTITREVRRQKHMEISSAFEVATMPLFFNGNRSSATKKNKCSKYSNLTVFLTVPHIYPIVNNLGDVQHQRIDQPSSLYQQVF